MVVASTAAMRRDWACSKRERSQVVHDAFKSGAIAAANLKEK
jgi:hypothetical protein